MFQRAIAFWLTSSLAALTAAAPYSIYYSGDDFPENEGWTRYFLGENTNGAIRTIEDGALGLDSMGDTTISDCYEVARDIDAASGELFIAEWRVNVVASAGRPTAALVLARDGVGLLAFQYDQDRIYSAFEGWAVAITPGFHSYRLVSSDMVQYELSIDGVSTRNGTWDLNIPPVYGFVGFGDCSHGTNELSHVRWDYVSVSAIPEPASGWAGLTLAVFMVRSRTWQRA